MRIRSGYDLVVGANEGYALRAMLWAQVHVHGHLLRDEGSSRMGVIGAVEALWGAAIVRPLKALLHQGRTSTNEEIFF